MSRQEVTRARRRSRAAAICFSACGVAALAAVVVLSPRVTGWGSVGHDALVAGEVSESVAPATTTLSCPGPVSPLADEDGSEQTVTSKMTSRLAVAELAPGAHDEIIAADDASSPVAELTGVAPLAALGATSVMTPGPFAVRGTAAAVDDSGSSSDEAAPNTGDADNDPVARPAEPVGAVGYVQTEGDLRGVAAAACSEASSDQWLVAGSTQPGRSSTLVLDNPGTTTAAVQVALWGATGPIGPSTATTVVLPALGHKELVLGSVAPGERRLAIHVTSRGGAVGAVVTESRLDGTVPRGVTMAVPGAAPSRMQAVGGLVLEKTSVNDDDAGVLRLLSPTAAASAQIWVLGPHGRHVLRGAESVDLARGEVSDVSLAGLPAGPVTLVVTADQPVLAAALVVHQGEKVTESSGSVHVKVGTSADVAWVASSTILGAGSDAPDEPEDSAVAVPAGLGGTVVLSAVPHGTKDRAAALAAIPVDYGDDQSADQATADDASEQGQRARDRGLLVAYGPGGGKVGEAPVSLPDGGTTSVALNNLAPGEKVAAVVLQPAATVSSDTAQAVVWGLAVNSPNLDGGVSVLAPRRPGQAARTVTVRSASSVGR